MRKDRYYFSPRSSREKTNEYVDNFFEELSNRVDLVNYHSVPTSRSIDYLKYSLNSDVMILNWPEDIVHLRFGVFQFILSCITFSLYRIMGGKIVWVCHNKNSHKKKHKFLSDLARKFYTSISNHIIVHSKDALDHFTNCKQKTHYLAHPVYRKPSQEISEGGLEETDVLIWGNIIPYKGLNEFVNHYKEHKCNFSVLIIGKAQHDYSEKLKQNAIGLNIKIVDKFVGYDDLQGYFNKARLIVLPYLNTDTFSSGALIHSLNSNKVIIGPLTGNFIDLNNYGACLTYTNRDELFFTINRLLADDDYYERTLMDIERGINRYYSLNPWSKFVDDLINIINPKSILKPYILKRTFTIDSLN